MTAPVRVGLVGCGRLAECGYIPAFAQTDAVSLEAVADLDPARCESLAPGVPAYVTVGDLLADADVELLVLAHAVESHVVDACAASAAGVTSLVEKPPARTAAEAEPLVGLEPAAWVGFNRRFEPAITTMRAQFTTAPPTVLELELSVLPSAWGALDGSEAALLDLGPHVVDLALWLTGCSPVRLRARQAAAGDAAFELDLGDVYASVRVSHERAWCERVVARDARGGRWRRWSGEVSHVVWSNGCASGARGRWSARWRHNWQLLLEPCAGRPATHGSPARQRASQ